MKKRFILVLLGFCVSVTWLIAQSQDSPESQKNKYRTPNSPVDNISYWVKMAEDGIVPFNESFPVKPAEYIGSRVKGDPIDQMSTDVCVWDETTIRQSENSVFIDPDDPEYILNSNNSDIGGSIYGANYIHSADAGQTWAGSHSGAGGSNSGDPATAIARSGRQFVGFINNSSGQSVAYSNDGTTWTPVVLSTTTDLLDKNHLWIDTRASGTYSGYLYSAWTRFQSGHTNDTDIEFCRSTTNGTSWSSPINISNAIAAGSHNQGVNIQTGPNGEVYCVWAVYDDWGSGLYEEDAIGFAKSTTGGSSFGAATRIHNNIKGGRSWNPVNDAGKNMRMNSFPSMAVDISGGAYNGYIYVVWANMGVPGTNTGTNMSVYCMRSTNGGTSWGTPVRVNQFYAADYAAFFPWITCDPVTGKLFCIFYDDRNLGSTSTACEVWVGYSEDGGTTWSDFRVGDVSFTPAPMSGLASGYFGDYLGIAARDGWVYPCWTDNRSGRALTYVSPVQFSDYCISSGGCDEYISNVSIGSINNSSSCEGYQNFTDLSTSIPANSSASLTVTNGSPWSSDQCGVWVDWNNDGDFTDANEQQTVAVTPGFGPYTATIAPPVGVSLGTKTMRIRITYTGDVLPCGNTIYGEVEDYTINVTAMVPNVWDGSFNHYWHNDNNWSLGHIPLSTEEVIIPNVGYQPVSVDFYDEACYNLTLESGATLNVYDQTLTVNGVMGIYGQIGMLADNGYINAMGNVIWYSGSTMNVTAANTFINAYGNWNFESGSNVNPAMGFVDFEGSTDCWIRCYSSTSSFYNFRVYKTGGAAAKVSNVCTQDLVVNNLTFTTSGSDFLSLSNNDIVMRGNFNYYGTFDFTQNSNTGSVIFDGTSQSINNYSTGSGIFNNVIFSSSVGTGITNGDVAINGNVTIEQGYFNPGAVVVTVGGNWTSNVGFGGTIAGTGTVVFHSLSGTAQDVNGNNNFNNVTQDNTGQYLRFNGDNILQGNLELHGFCWAYETMNINGTLNINDPISRFTTNGNGDVTAAILDQGGTLVSNGGGDITISDLAEAGLYGYYYINTAGGLIDITNNNWVDLNGEIHIADGIMNVSGTVSDWPYSANAVIEMSGGVLDFKTCGIQIANNAYTLTDNITGGTIRTAGGFWGNRADFTPAAGTFEFYGTTDANASQSNGCNLHDVVINKLGTDNIPDKTPVVSVDGRTDKTVGDGSKSNTFTLVTNFVVTGDLTITSGTFDLGAYSCNVSGFTQIYGTLAMTQPSCDLINGGAVYWESGSNDNITAGTFHSGHWQFKEGTNAMLGTGNTAYLENMYFPTDADAEFGNLVAVPFSKNTKPDTKANYPTRVAGNFTVQNGATWNFPYDLIVAGNTVIENGASLDIWNGADLYLTGTLGLTGTLYLEPGSIATVHNSVTFPATGYLNIFDGASFICDHNLAGTWTDLDGRIEMVGAALLEFSGRNVSIGSTFVDNSIFGGTMRFGRTLNATNASTFQLNYGTVEFIGSNSGHYVNVINGNYLNNMVVNKPSGTLQVYDILNLNGSMTITAGELNSYSNAIYLKGNWTNNVGPAGFAEGTGTVYFNGDGALNHQLINGTETFYNLTNAKTGGGQLQIASPVTVTNIFLANGINIVTGSALTVNGSLDLGTGTLGLSASAPTVIVNNFNMGGTLSVTNGSFTCTDVVNNGIYGTLNIYNGTTMLNQDIGQYPDLDATVAISGGNLTINGGNGASVWGWGSACSLTMSGGVLDFVNNGIWIGSPYTITENVTNGTIRSNGIFVIENLNFTPTGGTSELYGGSDAYIGTTNNSNFYNLLINKSGGSENIFGDNSESQQIESGNSMNQPAENLTINGKSDRPKIPDVETKANLIYTNNSLKVNGTTTVDEGTLLIDNYQASCYNNIIVNAGGILAIGDGGTLAIDNTRSLTVNSSGTLDVDGTAGIAATITHIAGNYALNVESGGTIGAVYGIFEYMNTNGVNIKNGSLVDVLKPFNYCTFRLGQAAGRLMSVENNQTFYVENAIFPNNTWAGSYNVYKAVNAGNVYFVTASGGFAGSAFEYDPNSRIHWTQRSLSLKAYMEGPFNGVNMNTTLNGILPLSHPFNPTLPYFGNPMPDWYYAGAGTVGAIPNPNIVDWVLVELRDAATAATALKATMVAQMPGFILNNGSIVALDGASNLQFSNVIANNLFVVIYHRNHESIMNANVIPYASGAFTYDYSTGLGQVYGGAAGHKEITPGVWGMRSGDGDGNCDVQNADRDNVWDIQAGKTGYLPSDYNMNRQTNNVDKNDKWDPNLGTGSQVPN